MPQSVSNSSSYFLVSITGQVEYGCFPDYDDLYCRVFWVCGQDWSVTAGQEEGVSQVRVAAINLFWGRAMLKIYQKVGSLYHLSIVTYTKPGSSIKQSKIF